MKWYKKTLTIRTRGIGMLPITEQVTEYLRKWQVNEGMCHLYIQHTSASLTINESFDHTAQVDMEAFMERIAPQEQPWMSHTMEGKDDSSSHLRTMLTNVSLSIPIENGELCLGTWQGIYLLEHRNSPHNRQILVRCLSIEEGDINE